MTTIAPHHDDEPPAPLKFDRRCGDRSETGGDASLFMLSGDEFGRIQEIELQEMSAGGLGAISEEAVAPGTIVSIGFARFDRLARRGIVRRCIPCGHGYRVGIQFELGLAA